MDYPSFPSPKKVSKRNEEKFIEERRQQLQAYLSKVIQLPYSRNNPDLLMYFCFYRKVRIVGFWSSQSLHVSPKRTFFQNRSRAPSRSRTLSLSSRMSRVLRSTILAIIIRISTFTGRMRRRTLWWMNGNKRWLLMMISFKNSHFLNRKYHNYWALNYVYIFLCILFLVFCWRILCFGGLGRKEWHFLEIIGSDKEVHIILLFTKRENFNYLRFPFLFTISCWYVLDHRNNYSNERIE